MGRRLKRSYHCSSPNIMQAIRKWVNKPKRTDTRLLAQFYFADEELLRITQELDSFDGRSEPDRCSYLIAELKVAQEKVIGLIEEIKNVVAPNEDSSNREFRVKFPDEVLQDNLAGQLWFGAECLCAGSTIVNREQESIEMRPMAKQVVKSLNKLRSQLREQALRNLNVYPSSIRDSLVSFDELFAQFEFEYVSTLSRVRTVDDHDKLQDISVLLCETVTRAVEKGLLRQEMLEDYDPALMITIPRLAIICGVLVYSDGPLDLSKGPEALPVMFKPFYKLLRKIRDLLLTLSEDELFILEKTLCSDENFEEVVLAADAILSSSKMTYSKGKGGPRKRYGSVFPDIFPMATDDRELRSIEESIREIANKIEPDQDVSEVSQNSRDYHPPVPPNLTIVTEVEVHNSFNDESRPSTSTPENSPNSSGHNSKEGTPIVASEESIYDPPPPYSSAAEDGYSSSNEGEDHFHRHPETSRLLPEEASNPGMLSLPTEDRRRYSSTDTSNEGASPVTGRSKRKPTPPDSNSSTLNSTSSTSTMFLYRDSSSDTESEGLIPQKLHLLRGKFKSTRDLIHTLFVCISGVADQLQSNYASDLRQTLKSVFLSMSACSDKEIDDPKADITKGWLTSKQHFAFKLHEEPPPWTDDTECVCCSLCSACFSFFRRRHHCRLCGKIFCSGCASNFVPLPRYGLVQPVRVCTTCIETALDRLM